MKLNEWKRVAKQLLPSLPGFAVHGKLLMDAPIGDFVRGLCFQSSADANCFYLWVFFLPLFVPTDDLGMTHGKRLTGKRGQGWYTDDPNLVEDLANSIRNQALPFLNSVSTLEQVRDQLKVHVDSRRPRVNSHILEALAYTLIKCGDYDSALEALAEQEQSLEKETIPWVIEQRGRAQLIEAKLRDNPEAALAQLEVWKAESAKNLGLEKYVAL